MDIVLVPGFWLDASSWAEVTPPLTAAGHHVHPLTLPGKESLEADRSTIGLRDHVDAVAAVIDSIEGEVVLVGHSGGGAIISGAADARPSRVARAVYVDSWPLGHGGLINDELPAIGREVPLPDWSVFDDEDLVDLTDELREQFRARSIPEPLGVTSDRQVLSNDARYDVPTTVIACEFSAADLTAWLDGGMPMLAELARVRDREIVELRTGHWPQFTRPTELGATILAAVDRG